MLLEPAEPTQPIVSESSERRRAKTRLTTQLSLTRARYRQCPSDYLCGAIAALSWMNEESPHSPLTMQAIHADTADIEQEYEEADSSAQSTADIPLHEFCTGISTSLAWALGYTATPPIS